MRGQWLRVVSFACNRSPFPPGRFAAVAKPKLVKKVLPNRHKLSKFAATSRGKVPVSGGNL